MKHLVDWGPGFRFFGCYIITCGHKWKEACRDCMSPSSSPCPKCSEVIYPASYEKHYDWPTEHGNLIEGHNYG